MRTRQISNLVEKAILEIIERYSIKEIHICLSGGMDSVCLLEVITELTLPNSISLEVVHFNHRLSEYGNKAERFCKKISAEKNLRFSPFQAPEDLQPTNNLEEWARVVRYECISRNLKKSSLAVTAHHSKDQTETIIQRILRGSGPYGLTGMTPLRKLGDGWLFRPFLGIDKEELIKFSTIRKLKWTEDPMNQELRFSRNRIRHVIIPELDTLSNRLDKNLQKMARIQNDIVRYIEFLTEKAVIENLEDKRRVPLSLLEKVDERIKIFVLHAILRRFGIFKISQKTLEEILRQINQASRAKSPSFEIGDRVVKLHRNSLFVLKNCIDYNYRPKPSLWKITDPKEFSWGTLKCLNSQDDTILNSNKHLIIKFRNNGDTISEAGRSSKKLKKIFQELSVPPWERYLIPIIYESNEIIALGGHTMAFYSRSNQHKKQIIFDWKIYHSIL